MEIVRSVRFVEESCKTGSAGALAKPEPQLHPIDITNTSARHIDNTTPCLPYRGQSERDSLRLPCGPPRPGLSRLHSAPMRPTSRHLMNTRLPPMMRPPSSSPAIRPRFGRKERPQEWLISPTITSLRITGHRTSRWNMESRIGLTCSQQLLPYPQACHGRQRAR
jgi:hypothetical protein